jgi:putative ABC transport system permease protein
MWLTQVLTVSVFNLRNLKQRVGPSLATVVGVSGVVLVVIGVLSIASGFERTMTSTGDPENVIVMRAGANDEMSSGLILEQTKLVAEKAEVARNERGPIASAELYVIIDLPKRGKGTPANVPLRGISPEAYDVRGNFEIVEGRKFEPGRNEIIVGESAVTQFDGLHVGDEIRSGENAWRVVGIFTTGGTVEDSEIWCDARVLQPAYRRGNSFQSVHLRLNDGEDFQAFKDGLSRDPRLSVHAVSEAAYWTGNSSLLTATLRGAALLIGGLMGLGAVFGALNTMYTAVSARTREIATLRALGFGTSPVVVSVLVEALCLAAVGGVLGAGVSYVLFNGVQTATMNWQTFSQVAFAFEVTPSLMVGGFLYALLMGLVGGFFPAVRAARLPVATALRGL